MSFNGIFMAVPGYHHILQGYYEGNFICFTWKSFGDILKKCIKQQFKRAKIFGSIFLDFSPAWEKSVLGGRCRRERKELEITLFPSPSAPFPNSLWHSKWTWGWRGRMLLLKSSLCQTSLWRGLILMSMNRRPLPDHVSRPGLLMAVFPAL